MKAAFANFKERLSKIKWKQRYYFYFHIAYIILCGLIGGLILFALEAKRDVNFIDTLFTATSSITITGLVTTDFSKFSTASQIFVLFWMIMGGISFTAFPAMLINLVKYYKRMKVKQRELKESIKELETKKKVEFVDATLAKVPQQFINSSNHGKTFDIERDLIPENDAAHKVMTMVLESHSIAASDVPFYAHLIIIPLVFGTVFFIQFIFFIAMGFVLQFKYGSENLENNNPWWASLFLTVCAYNTAGISPFSDGMARFATDFAINIFIMILALLGNTLYPAFLRVSCIIQLKSVASFILQRLQF